MKKKIYRMEAIFRKAIVFAITLAFATPSIADDDEGDCLIGFNFGSAFTSNPSSMQKLTGRSHYVDYFGQIVVLCHAQFKDTYSFELQFPFPLLGVYSTVHTLDHSEDETKFKWSFPIDCRWFLGNDIISAYFGAGIQYSTVWNFISKSSDGYTQTYYDPWWGVYYQEYYEGEDDFKWKWTANQLSANLAMGIKLGIINADAKDPQTGYWNTYRRLNVILGAKFHFPIINNGEKHGDGDSYVDLSRDKTFVSLTGGLSWNWPGGALKVDYEYPLGGTNKYAVYDGGHGTFFNQQSQSISATLLFKM